MVGAARRSREAAVGEGAGAGVARSVPAATGAGWADRAGARLAGAVTDGTARSSDRGAGVPPSRTAATSTPAPATTTAVSTPASSATGRRRPARCLGGSATRGTVPAVRPGPAPRPRSASAPPRTARGGRTSRYEASSPYWTASASASQDASMTLACTPTVVHSRRPSPVSTSTRVTASVPCRPSRIRTL